MSVVINTNYSATLASNNLAVSNASLQKSLNRLSSGTKIVSPADDAGGLAVSMKLGAASRRQGAVSSNIGNAASLLQTQDGNLKVVARVLDRISELKMLHSDVTKNASDKANYNSEFTALQAQLTAIGSEKFNGVALFGSTDLSVATTEDGSASSAVAVKGVNLLGTGGGASVWTDISGINLSGDWNESTGGLMDQSAPPKIYFNNNGTLTSSQSNITGPFSMSFSFFFGGGASSVNLSIGGASLDLSAAVGGGFGTHTIAIVNNGTQTTYQVDSGSTVVTADLTNGAGGTVSFNLSGYISGPSAGIGNFTLTNNGGGGGGGGTGNVASVAAASDLGSLNLSTVTSAIQDVATYRAQNGATQSRLGFADELLTTNKANLEAANSRIIDVDVASESTQLARFNTLVQAGTSMLSQANQSAQISLRLLQ